MGKRLVSNSMNRFLPSLSALQISPPSTSASQVAVNIGMSELQDAAGNGHHDKVDTYIAGGAAVDEVTDENNWTPLFYAAEYGRKQVARVLLNHGAAVNHQAINGLTALIVASEWGYALFARILIEHDALVDHVTNTGRTALIMSAQFGHHSVVSLLLEKGAKVDYAETSNQWTALMWSASEGHGFVVRTLLEHSEDVNYATPSQGVTALMVSAKKVHYALLTRF